VAAADLEVDDGVAEDLAQGGHAHLGEGGDAVLVVVRAEVLAVVGGVGRLEGAAVQGQKPPAFEVGAGQRAGRADQAAEEQAQGADAEALAGVHEGGRVGRPLLGQGAHLQPDVGEALVAPQRAGEDEVDGVVGGQAALVDAVASGLFEDGEDDLHGAQEHHGAGVIEGQAGTQLQFGQCAEGALEAAEQGGVRGGRFRRRG